MTSHQTFSELAAQLRDFIGRRSTPAGLLNERETVLPLLGERAGVRASLISNEPEDDFNRLALSLFALQFSDNSPFRRFCESRRASPKTVEHWSQIPAVPAAAFKEFELTSLPADQRTRVFYSSGTTTQRPGRHFHDAQSLSLYEASLLPWFQAHLLPGFSPANPQSAIRNPKVRFLSLTPPPELAPHSSLVHMFAAIHAKFGSPDSDFTGLVQADATWDVDFDRSLAALHDAIAAKLPVVIIGTAFNFVQFADHLERAGLRLALPDGSRVLETGGYKGRTRSLSKPDLLALISHVLGVPPWRIVSEYGMSELSSQAYDSKIELSNSDCHGERNLALPQEECGRPRPQQRPNIKALGNGLDPGTSQIAAPGDGCTPPAYERTFRFPPWARAQIISPETGREVADGETGLIRVFDLANLRSVLAVQTEDLGVRRGNGFELLGRAALAEARGCSLMSA